MNTASVEERLKENGATIVARTRRSQDYLQKFVEIEIEKWGAAIKAAGVTGESFDCAGGTGGNSEALGILKIFRGHARCTQRFLAGQCIWKPTIQLNEEQAVAVRELDPTAHLSLKHDQFVALARHSPLQVATWA